MSKHLKRLPAPTTWKLERKTAKFVTKPLPGKHKLWEMIPLTLLIRDYLHYCDNAREAKKIVCSGDVKIDGKVVREPKQGVGLMDVVSFERIGEHYRILLDRNGKLVPVRISPEEAKWKLVRIENKTTQKGGITQLNLHDGRNILVENPNQYKTWDTLKIEIPSQKIMNRLGFEIGNVCYFIGGKHVGEIATIAGQEVMPGSRPNVVYLKEGFSTVKEKVFVVGIKVPEITLPEVRVV
ncbi:MAG: 30S ribosomal protein S4e [Thermoplasmata archaeon]